MRYAILVALFLVAVGLFFGGLFLGNAFMVVFGAVLLLVLFVTRRTFVPVQEREREP